MTSSRALIDANVLVYAALPNAPQHAEALKLCNRALAGEAGFCLAPQVLFEFYATLTHPKRVQPPRTVDEAKREIEKYRTVVPLIHPTHAIVDDLAGLLASVPVTALDIFDLVLAATMIENGVTDIYTFDPHVFSRVAAIRVRAP